MNYRQLEEKLTRNYSELYERYPNAAFFLDKEIRNSLSGRFDYAKKNLISYTRVGIYLLIRLALKKVILYFPGKKEKIYLDVRRFSALKAAIKQYAAGSGLEVIDPSKQSFINKFFLKYDKNLVYGLRTRFIMKKIVKKFIETQEFEMSQISKLNQCVEQDLLRTKNEVSRLGIKLILLVDDQRGHSQILVRSRGCAKSVVFAHGYIQDEAMVSILPINADILCVWNDVQKQMVLQADSSLPEDKVINFGYPYSDISKINHEEVLYKRYDCLIILDPIFGKNSHYNEVDIASFIEQVTSIFSVVAVRLHPKDRENQDVLDYIEPLNIKLNTGDLFESLLGSKIVLGTNSSVLYESMLINVPTYQISEFAIIDFVSVPRISVNNLGDLNIARVNGSVKFLNEKDSIDMLVRVEAILNNLYPVGGQA